MAGTYNKPPWLMAHVINPVVVFVVGRLPFGPGGKAVLEVRKRKSGGTQRLPVNVLTVGNDRYLVAPRGQCEWVRNARAAGTARLLSRGKSEDVKLTEVPDSEKAPILQTYYKRWHSEVKDLFAVSGPDAPESEFAKVADDHPVFRLAG